MAEQLYFSRDTKIYVEQGSNVWALPVLQGYSFSQNTNTSEVTLNEMSDVSGTSRRGRQMFTDSVSPAEWSFSTYLRPFIAVPAATNGWEDTTANHHAIEEVLWANFVAINKYTAGVGWDYGVTHSTSNLVIDFDDSNKSTLGTFNLYFEFGGCSDVPVKTIYKLTDCAVNSAGIDFDIEGIATINWSGFGTTITEVPSVPAVTIAEAVTATSNFIRNRLTSLTITADDTTNFPGVSSNGVYNAVLTGGSINFENNISYLTPEVMCIVNVPIGMQTGARTVSGSFTAYLNADTGSTAQLFKDLANATTEIVNKFALVFSVGGSTAPKVEFNFPQCHLSIPSPSIDDVIAIDVEFSALPSTISETDEATITYTGVAY